MMGALQPRRVAYAVDPAPCPQYECRTIHAYWDADPDKAYAFFVAGKADNDSIAMVNIFTDTSVEQKPVLNADGRVDIRVFPACTPHCGKDNGGKGNWQAQQSVTVLGVGKNKTENDFKTICTPGGGTQIQNPENKNAKGESPPTGDGS
jgi:hypothetical protein